MKCQSCGETLENEFNVYGDVGETLCWACWSDMVDAERGYSEVYGIGPHHHDMSITGSIIGSTVFDALEGERDADGWYHINEKVWYKPDTNPDGEGMGLWRYYE